ncbi:MAG: peptidoglycan-binding domain-containing protein [Patescibacteria group bacterium]
MKKTFKAAIFALALTVTVGASAEGYMFNTNLTVGSRGADVTALQNILAAGGYFTATPTGYFGSITKTAVMAYQRANAITPVSGYFGPLTRATMNSSVTTTTPTTPAACPVGYVCQPTTSTGSTSGSEGFAEVRIAVTPTNNPNVQISTDVPVYGIEFRAKQSDITVERINLEVAVNAGTTGSPSYENPSTLINTVIIKDGSTVLQTIPVNSTTFSKITTNGSSTYYLQLAGLGFKVTKDTAKNLSVSFNTNSIDSDRIVTVGTYLDQGIRVVDGRGISSYTTVSEDRVHTFKKPGTSTVTAKADATTLYANNYRVNVNGNGAEKVLSSTFAVKSDTGSSKLNSVTAQVVASGTTPTNLYLYDGSTIVDARSVPAPVSGTSTVIFDVSNANITVPADTTKTFSIKADLPSNTATGTVIQTTVTAVSYEKPNGSSATIGGLTIAGPYNYFAPVVAKFSKVSSTVTTQSNNNINTSIVSSVRLGLMADGGDISTSTSAVIGIKNVQTGAILATTTVSGTPSESGLAVFADGASKYVDFTATFSSSTLPAGTTNVRTFVQSVTWTPMASGVAVTQSRGFEAFDSDSFATFSK